VRPDLDALRGLWRTRETLVLLQIGFGDGATFLDLWQAWRDDGQRQASLVFIAIDPASIAATALRAAHADAALEAMAFCSASGGTKNIKGFKSLA